MIIGYGHLPALADAAALDRLRQALTEAGAETVFIEAPRPTGSSEIGSWPALDCALASSGRGDVLLALAPAHLARSVAGLLQIADRLAARGASLRVMQVAGHQMLDTATPSGATMLAALGLLNAFGHVGAGPLFGHAPQPAAMPGELAPASFAPSRPRGRPPTASTQAVEIARLRAAGMRASDIADRLKICRASVYRVLNMTTGIAPAGAAELPVSPAATRPAAKPTVQPARAYPPIARQFSLHRS
jgi:DNA invertase Pin-like site-specific DNA recombinase